MSLADLIARYRRKYRYFMYIVNHDGTQDTFEVINFNYTNVFDRKFLAGDDDPTLADIKAVTTNVKNTGNLIFALPTDKVTLRFINAMNNKLKIHWMVLAVENYVAQTSVVYRDSPSWVLQEAITLEDVSVLNVWPRVNDPNVGKGYDWLDVVSVRAAKTALDTWSEVLIGKNWRLNWYPNENRPISVSTR